MSSALNTDDTITQNDVQLDEQQQLAVDHDDGPLAVLAGPGAGKTRVIVQRLVRLLTPIEQGGRGVSPESVVALAFTIKSAGELRDRLHAQLDKAIVERLFVGTSHSFGRLLFNKFADMLGVNPRARIADTAQCKRLLREIIVKHDLLQTRQVHTRLAAIPELFVFFEKCRNDDVSPDAATRWINSRRASLETNEDNLDHEALAAARAQLILDADFVELFNHFERQRFENGLLLLDDFLSLPLRILREHPNAASIIRSDFRHFVIDEFQDWNPAQINLLAALAPPRSASGSPADICVVGDDDQSIYAFRGADNRAFERFEKLYENPTVIELGTNYRADPLLVAVSQHIIEQSTHRFRDDKILAAHKSHDPAASIECIAVPTADDFGPTIAAALLDAHQNHAQPWEHTAVLVRSAVMRDRVLAACDLADIPTTTRRVPTPLDDAAVQDLLAWCRLLADPSQSFALQRILLRPPIAMPPLHLQSLNGEWRKQSRTLARTQAREPEAFLTWLLREHPDDQHIKLLASIYNPLQAVAVSQQAPHVIHAILHEANLAHAEPLSPRQHAHRVEALVHVVRCLEKLAPALPQPGDLKAFLTHYDDLNDNEKQFQILDDSRVDTLEQLDELQAVTVLTAHSAKGLEFDTVYVAGVHPLGRGGFPSTSPPDKHLVELDDSITGRVTNHNLDEERRLFYVACTRAERRLVLLAKAKKKRTNSEDYFYEIKEDANVEVIEHTADEVLNRVGISLDSTSALKSQKATHRWVHEELSAARNTAASLLHRASLDTTTIPELQDIQKQLATAASRIFGLANLEAHNAVPDDLLDNPDLESYFAPLIKRLDRDDKSSSILKPLAAPLELSYTQINAYSRCPRCFYLQHVMHFSEPPTPQLAVGSIIHDSIESFLRQSELAQADGRPAPAPEKLLTIAENNYLANHLMQADSLDEYRKQIAALLQNYIEHFHSSQAELLIIEGTSPDSTSRVPPFPYEHDSISHAIIAKPDRVDRVSNGNFRIVDYKTGKPKKTLLNPARDDLQLAIYALFLQNFYSLEEPPQGVAQYWLLSEGSTGTLPLEKINWDKVHDKIQHAIEGMLKGDFPKGQKCWGACDILGN